MKIGKKGTTHVEMIISFAVFISFLIFVLIIFSPLKLFSKNSADLDITKDKILEHVSVNLSVFSLKINSSEYALITEDCVNAEFDSSLLPEKILMKDEEGTLINSTINTRLYFDEAGMFYKIYSSVELEEKAASTTGCYSLDKEYYNLGVERFYKKVSLTKLIQFFVDYNSNYEQLKTDLNLKNNFNVFILNSTGGIIQGFEAEIDKPEAVEVLAVNTPIEILDKNATLIPAIINIQVW